MKARFFARFSLGVLIYNLLVILWGAYVRATGSGAGCGAHWPLCNGQVVPRSPQVETLIEFSHRITSGLVLLLAIVLFVLARRLFRRGSLLRWASGWVLLFTITEALVGAGLVLFGLVADNASPERAVSMIVHLLNTFLLLAGLCATSWWAWIGEPEYLRWRPGALWLILGLCALAALGASGAVTALGDTLFPSGSLTEGLQQDFSPAAHFLLRLRVFHPMLAIAVGFYIVLVAWKLRPGSGVERYVAPFLTAIFVLQLGLGALNVILLAPVWMQLVHLLVADLIWIGQVLFTLLYLSAETS